MRSLPRRSPSQTLPAALVSELLAAGLSRATVDTMDGWKAREVLDLLRSAHRQPEPWAGVATGPRSAPAGGEPSRATI